METEFNYTTLLDVKFDHFQKMDIAQMVKACKENGSTKHLRK
jgi:hypothetical protein